MFPKENQTRNDNDYLTDGLKILPKPLGEYVSPPHAKLCWQFDQASVSPLLSNFDNTGHNAYEQQTGEIGMRSCPVYKRTRTVEEPGEGSQDASVFSNGEHSVKVHSTESRHVETLLLATFLEKLRYFTNQKMWDFMHLDDNGE
jgi:hypothetical protein